MIVGSVHSRLREKPMRVRLLVIGLFGLVLLCGAGRAWAVDDQNCSDFPTQASAQQHLREDPSDPDRLDADNNGIACEDNGGAQDRTPVNRSGPAPTTPPQSTATSVAPGATVVSADGSIRVTEGPSIAASSGELPATGSMTTTLAIAAAVLLLVGARMRYLRPLGRHWL